MTKEQILENLKCFPDLSDPGCYLSLAEDSQDTVFILDQEGSVKYINSHGSGLFGVSREEIMGKNIKDIFMPQDYETLRNSLQSVIDSGKPSYTEIKLNFNGKNKYVGTRCIPIKNKDNKIAIFGYCRDLTQHRKIYEDLELERRQLLSIFDGMDEVVYITDPTTYDILYCNKALASSLVNPSSLINGGKCYQVFQNSDSPCPFCTNDKIFGENLGKTYIWEFQNRNNQRWYHCIDKAIHWPDDRMVRCEIAIDITENKEKTNLLSLNEARYRAIIEDQTELICRWLPNKTLSFVNEAYCRYFSKTREELIGKSFMPLIPQEDQTIVEEHFKILGPDNPILAHEHRVILPTGEIRWMQWVNRVIFDSQGGIIEFQGVGRDITERKQSADRLYKINECFLDFSPDAAENINRLTALCGELLGADCALYNYLDQGMLFCLGRWNAPNDFILSDRAEGHICFDVINRGKDELTILRNLQQSDYVRTDPNISKYQIQTYFGYPVKFGGSYKGVICAVYKRDYEPSEDDKKIISIIASAIAVEGERKRDQEKIKEGELFASDVFASIQDGISILDTDMNIIRVNPSMEKWYAHNMPIIGKKCYQAYHGRNQPCEICPSQETLKENRGAYRVVPRRGPEGEVIGWFDLFSFPLFNIKTGQLQGVIEYVRDITERRKAEEELMVNEARLLAAQSRARIGNWEWNLSTNELYWSNENYRIFGLDPQKVKPSLEAFLGTIEPGDIEFVKKSIEDALSGKKQYDIDFRIVRPDGKIGVVNAKAKVDFDETGKAFRMFGTVQDITERKQAEQKLESLNFELMKSNEKLKQFALKDTHTGLFNHRYLEEIMDTEFHRSRRYAHPFSVILLDIDYFKSINDVYGHHFGDVVLKQFAKQLKRLVRRYDIVVRFGGEEFVVVSPGSDRSTALMLAERLLDAVSLFNFGDKRHTVKLKLSIAVVSYPQDKVAKGMSLVELAEKIVDKLKETGGNSVCSSSIIKDQGHLDAKKEIEDTDIGFLKKKMAKLTKRVNQNLMEAVFAFAKTIEVKDHYTGEHVEKTVQYATEIAKILHLSQEEIEVIRQAAILHDLGKIGISERILHKKAKLTPREYAEIKKHPQIGVDIIRPIQYLRNIIPSILYHHERWDGKGYPTGLRGEEIPLGARIVAIADVYQALGSDRPYRKALPPDKVIEIIREGSGTQFDPQIVDGLMKVIQQ